jgi:hypothetical protein
MKTLISTSLALLLMASAAHAQQECSKCLSETQWIDIYSTCKNVCPAKDVEPYKVPKNCSLPELHGGGWVCSDAHVKQLGESRHPCSACVSCLGGTWQVCELVCAGMCAATGKWQCFVKAEQDIKATGRPPGDNFCERK